LVLCNFFGSGFDFEFSTVPYFIKTAVFSCDSLVISVLVDTPIFPVLYLYDSRTLLTDPQPGQPFADGKRLSDLTMLVFFSLFLLTFLIKTRVPYLLDLGHKGRVK